jgi:RNA polymerase sigma-54 factor
MALEAKLVQKMGQSLLMTPQLQQAIKLLQLGRLEYKEAIERELLENPALEEVRDEVQANGLPSPESEPTEPTILATPNSPSVAEEMTETSNSPVEAKADWDDYSDSFTDYQGSASLKGSADHEDRQYPEVASNSAQTLEQHLLDQVRLHDFSEQDRIIAQHIAGNLNRDGYLECSHEEIAAATGHDAEDIYMVADALRFFEPVGTCTRSLQDCLLTQLEFRGLGDSLESRIIRNHLEKLEKRKYDQIARAETVSIDEVGRAIRSIRTLDPKPGRAFSEETTRYVVPDVYVQKVGSEYVITLNEEGLPRLRISPYYSTLMKDPEHAGVNKSYLTERLRAASWLIKSIQQRQQTIYRVTESIMKFQRPFLENGIENLRPLVLKDVADDIEMHESTVSRVTTEKYVHTPQGIFELKFFFTSGIKTSSGDISSSSVKEKIKSIIAAEAPASPISDQQIVDLLKGEKIDIARRTVAKYRESLGIPSSSQRKRIL